MDEASIFISTEGHPRHREAYSTLMDFSTMDEFLINQKNNYSFSDWKYLEEHFRYLGYLSPMNNLVSFKIRDIILDSWEM